MKIDVIYQKSCQRMDELPDNSIDTILTSCPYWGLRDYGEDVKEIWGGDPDCEHDFNEYIRPSGGGHSNPEKAQVGASKKDIQRIFGAKAAFCRKCGAWFGALGLEPTFQLYLDHIMIVCAEVKRVLKKTGSFWLNMGDTYSATRWSSKPSTTGKSRPCSDVVLKKQISLPSKCLTGIPWRLALRLVDEQGWILRNAGIWNKPNSMPSSTKDRLSNSYEFLFHLVKNTKPQYYWNEKTGLMADRKPPKAKQKEGIDWEWRECPKCSGAGKIIQGIKAGNNDFGIVLSEKGPEICPRCKGTGKIKHSFWHSLGYWYDLDAIREPYTEPLNRWGGPKTKVTDRTKGNQFAIQERPGRERRPHGAGKNPGDVWQIPTQPRPEAHFATFADKLCLRPILATCPAEICKRCGKARVRITKSRFTAHTGTTQSEYKKGTSANRLALLRQAAREAGSEYLNERETIGWTDCGCNAGWDSGVLLDPFGGRGTSAVMAKKMGRHYIVYELKKEYCEKLIKPALEEIDPLFNWKTPSLQAREKK